MSGNFGEEKKWKAEDAEKLFKKLQEVKKQEKERVKEVLKYLTLCTYDIENQEQDDVTAEEKIELVDEIYVKVQEIFKVEE